MELAVIGTGYVGLVTGACLARVGHRVTCVDVRQDIVATLERGEVPFYEPGLETLIQEARQAGRFTATTSLDRAIAAADVSMIAVGTPTAGGEIDLSAVEAAARQIGRVLKATSRYHVVAVKSTVVPGTTDGIVRRAIEEESGRQAGEFGLCMNPEFLREGSAVDDFLQADRIIIGQWDRRSGDVVQRLYTSFDCPVLRVGLRNAELTKYASNALLALLISFSNELAGICEGIPDLDIETVMEGLRLDRRLSPMSEGRRVAPGILGYLRAGIGYGGSCLPKDVNALRAFAAANRLATPLLDAVSRINDDRPKRVAALLTRVLGGLERRKIAVLGLAFKPGTDDVRSSPALAVIDELEAAGASIQTYDGLATATVRTKRGAAVDIHRTPEAALAGADAAVITMADPRMRDWDWVALTNLMRRKIVVDGRNVLRGRTLPEGLSYYAIGQCAKPPSA